MLNLHNRQQSPDPEVIHFQSGLADGENFAYAALKQKHRALRDDFPQALSLRTHRALSWLQRAEQESEDDDARFIFLWIAFNAAYANDIHNGLRLSEMRMFSHFFTRLIAADREQQLDKILWKEFPRSIRLLLDNKYVFQPFWEYTKGEITEEEWQEKFQRSKASANRALGRMNTRKVLMIILERLYVLRNQLMHGNATWNSRTNREQVRDGANILGQLVPAMISIMLDCGTELWGDPRYPVVD